MTKSIICISAFGFADTVVIDGKAYVQDTHLPSVVIEDRDNKLYMYGQDALYERTGIGLSDNDHYSSRIPMALLWQQLKHLQPRDENKQHAANSIAKYIIQLACDTFDEHKRATASKDAATAASNATAANAAATTTAGANTAPAPVNDTVEPSNLNSENLASKLADGFSATTDGSIDQALSKLQASITDTQKLLSSAKGTPPAKSSRTNKAYLQAHCQLVICIPDNFDEAEQQALINAFSGFEVQLLWRSIATLLGHFNAHTHQDVMPEPSFAAIMATAKPANNLSIASMAEESQAKVATAQEANSFYEQLSQNNDVFAAFDKQVDAEDSKRTLESMRAKLEAMRAGVGNNNASTQTTLRLVEQTTNQPQDAQDNHHTPEDKDTATVHVLYIGPDSIDLSTYDLQLHTDQRYVIPIRRESVYRHCASGISFLHYAISYAYTFLSTELRESLASTYAEAQKQNDVNILKQLQNAVIAQVIYQFPEAWGQSDSSAKLRVLRVPQTQSQHQGISSWCHAHELLPAQDQAQVRSRLYALQSFYELYGCDDEQFIPYDTTMDMTQWVRKVMIDHHLDDLSFHEPHECILITGPMLNGKAHTIDSFVRMQAHPLSLRLTSHTIDWSDMALGGCLFQERLNLNDSQTYPTYLDRLTKLSMVISNKERTDYKEQVLINDDFIAPTQTITGSKVRLSINKGSDHVELYVSTDSAFNDDSINRATETPFTLQSPQVSVQKATLTFASGRKALNDEPVIVWVEQRALSGYAKIHIKPDPDAGDVSSVLPPHGEVQVFDPSKKVDFTETLPQLPRAYPPLSKPRGQLATTLQRRYNLTQEDIIFRGSRTHQDLVYYNGKFGSPAMQRKIHDRLLQDYSRHYDALRNTIKRGDFEAFCSRIDKCLPFPQAKPFGAPELEGIANTVALAVEKAFTLDTTTLNKDKLLHRYCMFVPDSKESVSKCCHWLLQRAPFNAHKMNDALLLIENHPQVFSPSSKDFSMGYEFARTLLNSSKESISATMYAPDLGIKIINKGSVIGSQLLSRSLRVMLYSLLYRKVDLNFINEQEIEELEVLLNKTMSRYQQIDSLVQLRTSPDFKAKFHSFVEEKLNILLPEVKKYLRKEGSNPNIMSELQDLDEEGAGAGAGEKED